jgi:diacylglycerol O-acyltransferase / wax synthase
MKQLTGLDATFLYMETPSTYGHVSGLSIYDRPSPDFDPLQEWRAQIERRLHLLEPLTRRLRNVPFNLDHPFWIEDPDFDLDFHVRHTAVPPPGGDRLVQDLVARIIARPLDRARPLWESYVIDGLAGDRFAILTKIHHATVDGASGVELLTIMLDTTPEGDDVTPPIVPPRRPEPVPSDAEVLGQAARTLARKPGRFLVLGARTMRSLGEASRNPVLRASGEQLRSGLRGPLGTVLNLGRDLPDVRDEVPEPLPRSAPASIFNASISPHRSFAYRSVSMDAIKAIKSTIGCTVNDVVMAVCAGGLRTYLERREALPDRPLVTMVPVSTRTGEETERWSNRVSAIFANLPTDEPDPLQRIRKVNNAMALAKGLHDALPADQLTEFADFPPPAVFARASRMATRFQLGNRATMPVNLTISNVPGPREPLYMAGAKLAHYVPVSTVAEGQGLNITVQSYCDTLDFGLVGCARLVPDIDVLLDDIVDEIEALAELVDIDVPVQLPPERIPGHDPKPAAKAAAKRAAKRATKKRAAKKTTKTQAAKKAAKRATKKQSATKAAKRTD